MIFKMSRISRRYNDLKDDTNIHCQNFLKKEEKRKEKKRNNYHEFITLFSFFYFLRIVGFISIIYFHTYVHT